ncbi:MAG TPA: DUF397 domain-containing protein [Streptosporangiaceae bacterium]
MTKVSEPRWRKSSYSGGGAEDCVEVAPITSTWHKSSASAEHGECIEAAPLPGTCDDPHHMIAVRDSKNPDGPRLHFTTVQWSAFTSRIKKAADGGAKYSPPLI